MVYIYIHRILSYLSYSILSICLSVYLSICLSIYLLTYDENQSHNTWDNHSRGKQSIFETAKAVTLPERLMDFHLSMGKMYENVAPWNPYHRRNPWNQQKMGKLEWGAHQVTRKESSDSASRLSRLLLKQQIATVLYINGVLMDDWWILMATQWLYASVPFFHLMANVCEWAKRKLQTRTIRWTIFLHIQTQENMEIWSTVISCCWLVVSIHPNKYDQLIIVQYHFVIPLCWYWLVNKHFHTIPWFPYWIIVIPKYIE